MANSYEKMLARQLYGYESPEVLFEDALRGRMMDEQTVRRCASICRKAAEAYDWGAGSKHSEEARRIGKAQAEWCEEEILRLMDKS